MGKRGSSGSSDGGNTKPHRASPARHWCFTWNYEDGSVVPEFLVSKLESLGCIFGFGEEIAPTTGQLHFQGWVSFDKKVRPKQAVGIEAIHWDHMKGTVEDCIKYCSKEGKYHTNYTPFKLDDDLESGNYREWQRDVINLINGPIDKRKVYWYYDPEGGAGKSALVRHLEINGKAIGLTGGKGNDIAYMLCQYKPENIKCVILDLPRSSEGYLSYNIIEQIKNGKIFSPKYESRGLMFNSPHLLIFANYAPPDMGMLSKDRWVVRNISTKPEEPLEGFKIV